MDVLVVACPYPNNSTRPALLPFLAVASLNKLKATDSLRHIIITRLTPERIATLARVVSACKQPPEVFMANAALQMLREKAGELVLLVVLLKGCKHY